MLDACFCVKIPYFVRTVDASALTSRPWLMCTRVLPVGRTLAHQTALLAAGGHFKLRDHQQKHTNARRTVLDGLKRTFEHSDPKEKAEHAPVQPGHAHIRCVTSLRRSENVENVRESAKR